MKTIASSFVAFAISASVSSAAFAGNGFLEVAQKPAGLSILAIGIVIGAAAVACWRKFRQ